MKITVEFELPQDQEVYDNFRNAQSMRHALNEFDRYIRTKTKYAPDSMSDDTLQAYMDVRETLNGMTEGLMNDE